MIMPLSLFGLKFLEWWYSSERSDVVRKVTSLPVPPPPGHIKVRRFHSSTTGSFHLLIIHQSSVHPLTHASHSYPTHSTPLLNSFPHSRIHKVYSFLQTQQYVLSASIQEETPQPLLAQGELVAEKLVSMYQYIFLSGVCSAMLVSMVTYIITDSVQSRCSLPRIVN